MNGNIVIPKKVVFYIFVAVATFYIFAYIANNYLITKPPALRLEMMITATILLDRRVGDDESYLESNCNFAQFSDDEGNKIYYSIQDTWGSVAEIGVFIPKFSDHIKRDKIVYGVDLLSSKIYVIAYPNGAYYVSDNIFSGHMMHKKLVKFLAQGKWKEYGGEWE